MLKLVSRMMKKLVDNVLPQHFQSDWVHQMSSSDRMLGQQIRRRSCQIVPETLRTKPRRGLNWKIPAGHLWRLKEAADWFVGRKQEVEELQSYITGMSRHSFVLYGGPGSGKTFQKVSLLL